MNYAEIVKISPRPVLVSYWMVNGSQAVMLSLQGEEDGSSAEALM
jgi:hypothetical protein